VSVSPLALFSEFGFGIAGLYFLLLAVAEGNAAPNTKYQIRNNKNRTRPKAKRPETPKTLHETPLK